MRGGRPRPFPGRPARAPPASRGAAGAGGTEVRRLLDREQADFLEKAARFDRVPLLRLEANDLETPISLFLKLRPLGATFLLESVEGGQAVGRYSFIGLRPYVRLRSRPGGTEVERRLGGRRERSWLPGTPWEALRSELRRERVAPVAAEVRFRGGAVGYLAYEAVRHLEPRLEAALGPGRLREPDSPAAGWPEAEFQFAETVVFLDHLLHRIGVLHLAPAGPAPLAAYHAALAAVEEVLAAIHGPLPATAFPAAAPGELRVRQGSSREEFLERVERLRAAIAAGEIFQAVLSQRWVLEGAPGALEIYRALRAINPSPYLFLIDFGERQLVGSSPELLVRVEAGEVSTRPIAGTRPRGATREEDERLAVELLADPKERAEHVMLVDLARNDVGRVAERGSVRVEELMGVERYSHVMHLVSSVRGRLRPGLDAIDALASCFPAGTVSGAPKVRAIELLAAEEGERRGPYAGAVGWFGFDGDMDTCIAIRTILCEPGRAEVQAGAGIVYDSVAEREWEESRNKAAALIRALEEAGGGPLLPAPARREVERA
ncbi:MAG: anthranilate synthase component I family protein [Clostridia bacterium]|nr:anthranilate synthase component I family protein [Clostridia bacterium]